MKDYIITITAVFTMVLGILLCHKYTLNTDYSDSMVSSESEKSSYSPIINTAPYDDNKSYNNFIPPVVTTVPAQSPIQNEYTNEYTDVFTEVPYYDEDTAETETTTTTYRSILENATAKETTVHQFSIIQNPQQIPQTEVTPRNPDDFSLIID